MAIALMRDDVAISLVTSKARLGGDGFAGILKKHIGHI